MDFKKAAELLSLCKEYDKPISQIMMDRECEMTEKPLDEIRSRMAVSLQIMKDATKEAINQPSQSMGGLIGGESRKLSDLQSSGKNIAGNLISKAIAYSMGVLEVNASMGLIVAAPTAGSSGVIPGVLLALQEEYDFTDEQIIDALFTCSAIGYLAMLNATVAGAVGGCQAEIGVAAAMAAAAVVELMGGTPEQCTDAASTVLMNMLGLVCDPVGGLVEYPCQNRNASGASNAIVAAEISLAGIHQLIPLDEMMEVADYALNHGYTVCWDGDVSEKGFSFKNGVAINPEVKKVEDFSNTDRARFEKMDEKERLEEVYKFEQPYPEVKVTPEVRQQGFEAFVTTDDHLMHLTGITKDQNGTKYYITKNSWGTDRNKFGGYLNMSESFVRAKTIYIMLHKDAIPKAIKAKLSL